MWTTNILIKSFHQHVSRDPTSWQVFDWHYHHSIGMDQYHAMGSTNKNWSYETFFIRFKASQCKSLSIKCNDCSQPAARWSFSALWWPARYFTSHWTPPTACLTSCLLRSALHSIPFNISQIISLIKEESKSIGCQCPCVCVCQHKELMVLKHTHTHSYEISERCVGATKRPREGDGYQPL